ncbi:uncharacterized protein MELLADRAFT_113507 [Melampsora larici-populina 98AG31]|uniref:Uncharacterized protein n=1 Tax=Melampsora larici-populina (strain 98AG31 / pathotype 3-4-7) TaxID=747676 RepID=F4SA49_MELLP|nr:uncharacterized protein MELLADRAFT_113507 [Melampsora larici-populina 98AG31]EGF98501.1 hypothetical protein MELLADRAFT_113507 [Melampsora larici-populina 98AG31]
MSTTNVLNKSVTSQRSGVPEDLNSQNPFIGPGAFDLVRFTTENTTVNDTSKTSKSPQEHLSEKLEEMEIQKHSLVSRVPTRQKKASVTPYYRKPKFAPARTPEPPRQHKRQRQSAVTVDLKELNKLGKSTE